MGANAQTTVPTFVASQVLTADQQNQSARTGVPVFASTVTRDAGFGGAGEKTLAEGQLCYVEGTGLQTYNGTAWVTWGAAGPGFVYVTGASFTTQTTVSLPNSTFTSTYRNYKVVWLLTGGANTFQTFTSRMRASGSDNTTSNYWQMTPGMNSNNAADSLGNANQTSWAFANGNPNTDAYVWTLDVFQPQQATNTLITGRLVAVESTGSHFLGRAIHGIFRATTQFDAMTLISGTASGMTGYYRVYAYADS